MATVHFEAHGPVRGSCGHEHRTLIDALACVERDQAACRSLGGGSYSDRQAVRFESGRQVMLSESEWAAQDAYWEAACP